VIGMVWESAIESLTAHKLRSALTLLGIIVGVAAVLSLDVFGQLTRQAVERQFGPLGATLVSIAPQVPPPPAGAVPGVPVKISADTAGPKPAFPADLDEKDLQAIQSLPHVSSAAAHSLVPGVQASANGQNGEVRLIGATPQFQSVMGYTLSGGSFFTDQDEASRANVVVIGARVAQMVFPDIDPVGQSAQLNGATFTIKGVLAVQGSNGELDLDDQGIVPYSVLDRLRGNARVFALSSTNPVTGNGVLIQVDDVANVRQVESSAIQLIQQLHPPKPGEQPYVASDFAQAIQSANQSTTAIQLTLGGVAAVTLLLGAFGLFSMMTVSVTERTKEIGLRMAVGARNRDVLNQFLLEAALLGMAGGTLGILIGFGLASAAGRMLPLVSGFYALPSPGASLGVLVGCVVLAMAFGTAPARRAANLDPAAALRRG
jgi:ABC-type antimicrobial peptide transport system permease subunit